MRRQFPTVGGWLVILGLVLSAVPAAADPVTTGQLDVLGLSITGVGSVSRGDVTVRIADSGFVEAALCSPCLAGETTSLTGLFVSSGGLIQLESPSFVLQPGLAAGELWTIRVPFSFHATSFDPGAPPASIDGIGLVTARFLTQSMLGFDGTLLFNFRTATYEFGATDALPTPEPASLLLIGTGMAGVWLRRRRR